MKRIISSLIISIVFLFMVASVYAQSTVTFAWDANTERDLAGYKIYKGSATRDYGQTVDVGDVTTYTWSGLQDGTHYFAATAYDTDGNESGYSNEIELTFDTTSPGAPKNFIVTITEVKSVTVERSGAD